MALTPSRISIVSGVGLPRVDRYPKIKGFASRRVANVTSSNGVAVKSDGASPSAKSCQRTGGSSKNRRSSKGVSGAKRNTNSEHGDFGMI